MVSLVTNAVPLILTPFDIIQFIIFSYDVLCQRLANKEIEAVTIRHSASKTLVIDLNLIVEFF
ncbi:hypothetical protein TUM4644_06000 [Shewanella colwelliana]|nr:hypothetical protein TUM4644_06000 [Shewanella colwelliana]